MCDGNIKFGGSPGPLLSIWIRADRPAMRQADRWETQEGARGSPGLQHHSGFPWKNACSSLRVYASHFLDTIWTFVTQLSPLEAPNASTASANYRASNLTHQTRNAQTPNNDSTFPALVLTNRTRCACAGKDIDKNIQPSHSPVQMFLKVLALQRQPIPLNTVASKRSAAVHLTLHSTPFLAPCFVTQ